MAKLDNYLKIQRCPHCSIDNPNLSCEIGDIESRSDDGLNTRYWRLYLCSRCGGAVIAACENGDNREVVEIYPSSICLDENLPKKIKMYLQQAIDSVFAPAGSVMLCASAVDSMLKEKGYNNGTLNARIIQANADGLLTKEMATWAHQIRLDANDQRHSDDNAELPTTADAKQAIEFTKTLSEFLFTIPSKVNRGIEDTKQKEVVLSNKN